MISRALTMARRWSTILFAIIFCSPLLGQEPGLGDSQRKVVKLYGAGGLGRIEAYGTGVMVSPHGHILTALSPLLESDPLRVVLWDGRPLDAKVIAIDTARQLAVVQVPGDFPIHYSLDETQSAEPGDRVFALSNCFGIAQGAEPLSVQRGRVAAVTILTARQGFEQFAFPGPVYVIDAVVNNPGAAGGALVSAEGKLLGILGKEVQNQASKTWVNFAVPTSSCQEFVQAVLSGSFEESGAMDPKRQPTLPRRDGLRGIVPLPDVLDKTPPYVDAVLPDSAAQKAGLMPDDLILFVDNKLIQSLSGLVAVLAGKPADATIKLVVLREEQLVSVDLGPEPMR